MKKENTNISKNIKSLMRVNNIPSMTKLAERCAGNITTRTLSRIISTPDESNPTLESLQIVADHFKIPVYALLIEDFPFGEARKNRLEKVSKEGYTLLYAFEKAPKNIQYAILESASFSLREVNKKASNNIKSSQSIYLKT